MRVMENTTKWTRVRAVGGALCDMLPVEDGFFCYGVDEEGGRRKIEPGEIMYQWDFWHICTDCYDAMVTYERYVKIIAAKRAATTRAHAR